MNSPLCDLEGKDRVVLCCENELCYQLSVVDYASGSAGPRAGTDGLTWFGCETSLEDSTTSHPSPTCHRNDGQGHGLSTLCNINAILRSSRIAMTTEFLVPLAPVRHSCKENFGSTPGSSPTLFHGHVHMLFDTFSPMRS
jgi:hypothetical protein